MSSLRRCPRRVSGARRWLRAAGVACVIALLATDLDGQTVQGRVSDAGTGAPIEGALVVLVDGAGQNRAATAADSTGRYQLDAPGPGRFRLRAEQFGYETRESDLFELTAGAGALSRDLRLNPAPVAIPGVEVATDQVNRRIRQFLGVSPGELRIRPVRSPTIREHAMRGDDLSDLMARRNIPNLQVLPSRSGPCFQFRARDCLPVFLDGARLNRSSITMLPLEMLNTIVIILPSETVAYPTGAVHLFSTGYMR